MRSLFQFVVRLHRIVMMPPFVMGLDIPQTFVAPPPLKARQGADL